MRYIRFVIEYGVHTMDPEKVDDIIFVAVLLLLTKFPSFGCFGFSECFDVRIHDLIIPMYNSK